MIYRGLADLVLIAHLGFVVFALLGGQLVARRPRLLWLHLVAVAWGAAIEFIGFPCPLTAVENSLRQRGGDAGYANGFIDHYVTALLYPQGLSRELQWILGAVVIALNAAIYARVLRRRRAPTKRGPENR